MQPGLQRKSFLPPSGKKIEAESLAGRIFVSATRIQKYCSPMQPGFLARERQKCAHIFLTC
jgi:hypothetical protein